MVERTIAWLVRGNRRLRYRGATKNNLWLHHRAAAINLRRLLALGMNLNRARNFAVFASARTTPPLTHTIAAAAPAMAPTRRRRASSLAGAFLQPTPRPDRLQVACPSPQPKTARRDPSLRAVSSPWSASSQSPARAGWEHADPGRPCSRRDVDQAARHGPSAHRSRQQMAVLVERRGLAEASRPGRGRLRGRVGIGLLQWLAGGESSRTMHAWTPSAGSPQPAPSCCTLALWGSSPTVLQTVILAYKRATGSRPGVEQQCTQLAALLQPPAAPWPRCRVAQRITVCSTA